MQTPEARAAFDTTPSGVTGFQHDAPTPQSLNYSIGVQRELGWGTVLDVTYAGSKTRTDRGDLQRTTICRMAPTSSTSTRRTSIRGPAASCRPTSCGPIVGMAPSAFARTPARRTTTPCRCSSTAGTSRASSSRWPTRWPRATTARHQPVRRRGSGLVLARADRRHAAAQPDHQLHLGCAGRQQAVGQLADPRRARRLAALGQHGVRLGRLGRA